MAFNGFKKTHTDLMSWQSASRAGPISQLGWRDGRSRESASLCCLHTASAPGKLGLIGLSGSPWEGQGVEGCYHQTCASL